MWAALAVAAMDFPDRAIAVLAELATAIRGDIDAMWLQYVIGLEPSSCVLKPYGVDMGP